MKTPLRFQVTEFDCGTVSLLNALSFLFERETIPADLIRAIHTYTLDCYDKDGNLGQGGTSKEAVRMLSRWVANYAEVNDFNIKCQRYEGEEVTEDLIDKIISKNGVIFARLWQDCEHYVIITELDDEYVYIFDSYYHDENYYDEDKEVEIIFDQPFKYNRKVKRCRLISEGKKDFSLGRAQDREVLAIYRKRR